MDTNLPLDNLRDMRVDEFREATAELGRSGAEIGLMFGAGERTGRRWHTGEMKVPPAVATLVRLLVALKRKERYSDLAEMLRREALYMESAQRQRDALRAAG